MNLSNQFKGCFVGLACGDYLGMPVEFSKGRAEVVNYFKGEKLRPVDFIHDTTGKSTLGYYTDDTCMAMCLAESLVENDFDVKDQFRRYKKWLFDGYNTPFGDRQFGIGNITLRMLMTLEEDNLPVELIHRESHGGNGALMRCAPIGLFYHKDIESLRDYSIKSAIITHNNSDAAWSCVVLNFFIAYSLLGKDKNDFVALFLADHKDCPDNIKELLLIDYGALPEKHNLDNSGYTLHTLKIALYSFFRTNNYEEAVTEAIFMGGDADTQGAVAGALAGAYYGRDSIPAAWADVLINRDYIERQAANLYEKNSLS